MKFSKFDLRMFHAAHVEAEKSDYKKEHIGCVLTYKKHIIGRGHNTNKSNPRQAEYNKYRTFNTSDGKFVNHACHAEISAIQSVPYPIGMDVDWGKVCAYVYRISDKPLGYANARPCPACMNALKDLGVRDIYYTDKCGYSYLRLEE